MNKYKLSFILFIITLGASVHADATEQMLYEFFAELHNVCGYPIHIRAWSFGYIDPIDVILDPEENTNVLTLYGLNNNPGDAEDGFHSYGLAISSKVAKKFLDREKFLDVLRKSKITKHGGTVIWTIKDPSLCPGE